MVGVQIPHHFRSPISLELMRDPVTVSTGQTYDRSSIEPWIAAGNTTCPVTRAPLLDFALIPNHTLPRLIQSWCVANRHSGVERIPTPKQPADPSRVRALLSQAASTSSAAAAPRLSSSFHNRLAPSAAAPDSSSSSSKMIVKAVAATVASSLVVAMLFFFAIQRRRRRKGPDHGPADAGGFTPMPRGGAPSLLDLKRP